MFYSFKSDLTKIGGVTFIWDIADFPQRCPFLAFNLTLIGCNFEKEARSPKPTTFSECWVRKDSVGSNPKKIPGTERFTQKITFSRI